MFYDNLLNDVTSNLISERDTLIRRQRYVIIALTTMLVLMSALFFVDHKQQAKQIKELDVAIEEVIEEMDDNIRVESFFSTVGYHYLVREDTPLTDETLTDILERAGAYYPEMLVAQASLESGRYTSRLAKESNNIYGMKVPGSRTHLQNGKDGDYGAYDTWQLCALCRVWLDFTVFPDKPTEEEYYEWLRRRYAEDQYYTEKIKNIIKQRHEKQRERERGGS